ncbi:MAG: hypothetical protein PHU80_09885 [Kiritimatiellae bacterium]|nr:hypothetical protein [Kiritimatiellia bacterium]
MKQWIVGSIILLAVMIAACAGDNTSIRLAVLAEDVSSESRTLADLLTVDLSRTVGIRVVER